MERGWAAWVLQQAAESAGVEAKGFIRHVLDGLAIGAERYGELDYEGRDNAEGGSFEARDVAAYALMEWADLENDLEAGLDEDYVQTARMYLGEAIRSAAKAASMLEMARRERQRGRDDRNLPPLRRQTSGVAP